MDVTSQKNNIPYSTSGDKSEDEKLLQPYEYITQIPGKGMRTNLTRAFNYWLIIPEDKLKIIEDIMQMLHNARLLLDDIEDNSVLRRGIPVAHSIYGLASTINAANYVTFIGLERAAELQHPNAMQVYMEHLLKMHRGQGMEIYWRDNYECPTEEEYNEMAIRKTGGLFMLAIKLMQLFSKNRDDFTNLVAILGMSFQILDDYKNLNSEIYFDNKSYCEDITEGRFSFPLVHALQSHPTDTRIINILRQRTKNNEVKKYCVSLLETFGSFEYTRKKLRELQQEALKEIAKLGENSIMESVIDIFFKALD